MSVPTTPASLPPSDPPSITAPAPSTGPAPTLATPAPSTGPAPTLATPTLATLPRFAARFGVGAGVGSGALAGNAVVEADVWPYWWWLGIGIEGERAGNIQGNFYALRGRASLRSRAGKSTWVSGTIAVGPARVETSKVQHFPCDDSDSLACGFAGTTKLVTDKRRENAAGAAFELGIHLQSKIEGSAMLRVAVDGPVVTVLLDGALGFGF